MTALAYEAPPTRRPRALIVALFALAFPIVVENMLHMMVGLTDVFLASHLPTDAPAATAAIGNVSYILWLIGLIAGAIGVGSTAIISRAVGARHNSLANSVCGQSVTASVLTGAAMAVVFIVLAVPLANLTQLKGNAHGYALYYIRILSLSLPFSVLMYAAGACLRGAGDSITPAISLIIVDVINMVFSGALARGWFGLPVMGFRGIAIGTIIAYVVGGIIMFGVLLSGRGKLRLHWHRLRPHWTTLKRIFRIGIPSGTETLLTWIAQFLVIMVINHADSTSVMAAAHIIAVRVEALSYMIGFGIATAAATLVGQSLGMNDPERAKKSAYLAYGVGAGIMSIGSIVFILFGGRLAHVMTNDEHVAHLAATCLFITAFTQPGFAAAIIFAGALRGAGDTIWVMVLNLCTVVGIRLAGAIIVGYWLKLGLGAIWIVLATELSIRGILVFTRFFHGGWRHARV